jgi:multiple sugar transport system substrate-binding protein
MNGKGNRSKTAIAGFVSLAVILTACSTDKGSGPQDGKTGADTPAPKPSEPVELVFYGNSTQPEEYFNTYYGDAIRKKFPDYKIAYLQRTKGNEIENLVASGTRFDIYYATVGNFESALQSYGLQLDMNELIKKHGIDTSKFEPTLLEAMKLNTGGSIFGLPVQTSVEILYYNKSLFDKFGVSYPKDGMTWDNAAELSAKLTREEGGVQYYGYTTTINHMLRMNQFSLPRVDPKTGKPTINTDARWKTYYETLYGKMMAGEAYKKRFTENSTLAASDAFIKTKEAAMYAFPSQLYLTNPEEMKAMEWDIVSLPVFKELPGIGSQSYPMFFGVTKLSKQPDAAAEVLKYMVSEEFQLGLARKGWMSSLTSEAVRKAYAQDTPFKDKNYKALFVKPAPIAYAPEYDPSLISNYIKPALDMLQGKVDLNTSLRMAEEEATKTINSAKAK